MFRKCDIAVVGAGAAGFMAAIGAGESGARVLLFNAHPRVGLKILMSGGTRCNVTHATVGPDSFNGGSRNAVGLVLKAFPAGATRTWFESLGVALKEEPGGKLFPVTDSADTVLDALASRAGALGVQTLAGHRVTSIRRAGDVFVLRTAGGPFEARAVVLTTGGMSYPKTGSDGTGYEIARSLGHTMVPLTPALTPLVLGGDLHPRLQGVTLPAALTLWLAGRRAVTCAGSLLFTHFGLTGPAALDLSRHWEDVPEGVERRVTAHFLPGPARPIREGGGLLDPGRAERPGGLPDMAALEDAWMSKARADSKATLKSHFWWSLPLSLIREQASRVPVDLSKTLGQVTREERRRFLSLLAAFPLDVTGTLGYRKAEVTAGGVPLTEVDPRRMASRVCPGLFLAGEILDVDGRLGGYNFQWAWSSGRVAGEAAGRWVRDSNRE